MFLQTFTPLQTGCLATDNSILCKQVFPYSLPSVGPGADPGVQAVSPQVTWSESRHIPSSRLPLLSAGPAVTPVAFTRWRYLLTAAHIWFQLTSLHEESENCQYFEKWALELDPDCKVRRNFCCCSWTLWNSRNSWTMIGSFFVVCPPMDLSTSDGLMMLCTQPEKWA